MCENGKCELFVALRQVTGHPACVKGTGRIFLPLVGTSHRVAVGTPWREVVHIKHTINRLSKGSVMLNWVLGEGGVKLHSELDPAEDFHQQREAIFQLETSSPLILFFPPPISQPVTMKNSLPCLCTYAWGDGQGNWILGEQKFSLWISQRFCATRLGASTPPEKMAQWYSCY